MSMRRSRRIFFTALAILALTTAWPVAGEKDKPKKPKKHPDDALVAHDPRMGPVGPPITTTSTTSTPTLGAGVAPGTASALVLYDSTGPYGWLGELYGLMTVNLVGHFGSWTAHPVVTYAAGEMASYTAVMYLGST